DATDAAFSETSQRAIDGEPWRGGLRRGPLAGLGSFGDAGTHGEDRDPVARARRFAEPFAGCDREVDQRARKSGVPGRVGARAGVRLSARAADGKWFGKDHFDARRVGRAVEPGCRW